jgi:hypothetical protein
LTTIQVPASIEEARNSLNGLGGLITAKEWERAALVYAFTRDGEPGEHWAEKRNDTINKRTGSGTLLSTREFAALGISGLRRKNTVALYRKAWQEAMGRNWVSSATPGDPVDLPSKPWRKDEGGVYESERAEAGRGADNGTIELPQTKDPEKLRQHFERHPDSAGRIADALPPTTRTRIAEEELAGRPRRDGTSTPRKVADHLSAAATQLVFALRLTSGMEASMAERENLSERLGRVQDLVDRISDSVAEKLDEQQIYDFLRSQA